jgi:DNA-binding beta-propeller fold protein YncE
MNGKLGILALAVVALLAAGCGGGSVSGTPTSAGSLPATPDTAHLATATSAAPPLGEGVVMVIGQRGDGEGQFQSPQGLALDAQGNVYVADRGNRRVQVFDPRGGFLMAIADARFTGPRYVALDEGGRIYVSDASERVDVFNGRGDPLQSFGQAGSLPSQFSQIADLVVDAAGDLYVVDSGNARVQKFSMLRGLLFTFGDVGEAADSVTRPQGIALDLEGNVYVADAQNGRIVKYDPGGSFLRAFETDIGELRDITLDQRGYIYATDAAARVVCILDDQGRIVMQAGEGQLSDPWGVAVDGDGRVYVADAGHHCVLVLALPGEVPTPGPAPTPVASSTPTLSPVEGVAPWPMYGQRTAHGSESGGRTRRPQREVDVSRGSPCQLPGHRC